MCNVSGTISLVSMTSSKLILDPNFPEANVLRFWYSENKNKSFKPASVNQASSCEFVKTFNFFRRENSQISLVWESLS